MSDQASDDHANRRPDVYSNDGPISSWHILRLPNRVLFNSIVRNRHQRHVEACGISARKEDEDRKDFDRPRGAQPINFSFECIPPGCRSSRGDLLPLRSSENR